MEVSVDSSCQCRACRLSILTLSNRHLNLERSTPEVIHGHWANPTEASDYIFEFRNLGMRKGVSLVRLCFGWSVEN